MLRAGYGIFYGGQENGPFSNPSPGFNPPFLSSEAFNTGCTAPSANPASGQQDCSISAANNGGLPLNVLAQGFPATSLTDPNAPELYSLDPHLVTPYTQQWHLGFEYQMPAATVLEISYAGSRGLKLFAFYNGNQAVPVPGTDSLPTAPRRPAQNNTWPGANGPCTLADPENCNPALDVAIDTFRSNTFSNYNSLQVRLEKRTRTDCNSKRPTRFRMRSTMLPARAWDRSTTEISRTSASPRATMATLISTCASASFSATCMTCRSGVGGCSQRRARALNEIIGNWQMNGVFSAATGNYYTATDINDVLGGDCGGTVDIIARVRISLAIPTPSRACRERCLIPARSRTIRIWGTFGDAGRNIIKGPATRPGHGVRQTIPAHSNRKDLSSELNFSMCSTT